jgi:phosphatidylglycerol---prolipoprotein diacylglyceryl transferase
VHPVLIKIGALAIPSFGALAAIGVLLALFLAQRTARTVGVAPNHVWNLSVVALFVALAGSRLLLVGINWHDLRRHPLWTFGLSTIHSPLLAGIVALLGALAAFWYMRWQRMPWAATLDVLSAPLVLALACEQWGALLAGSDYGTDSSVPWAVIYTHPLAARWSGTPLGIPLHPVQAYAALAYLTLAIALLVFLPLRRQPGDAAGFALMGIGVALYVTEFWRDREGRGPLLHGALDGPQVAAILLVAGGALMLRARREPKPQQQAEAVHE